MPPWRKEREGNHESRIQNYQSFLGVLRAFAVRRCWFVHWFGASKEHVHPFDEYFVVIQGEYTLGIQGREISLQAGQEYHIPQGVPHDGRFTAGTRTINAFGGKRAERRG